MLLYIGIQFIFIRNTKLQSQFEQNKPQTTMVKFFTKRKSRCKETRRTEVRTGSLEQDPAEGLGSNNCNTRLYNEVGTSSSDLPQEASSSTSTSASSSQCNLDLVKRLGLSDLIQPQSHQPVHLNVEHGENRTSIPLNNNNPNYFYCYYYLHRPADPNPDSPASTSSSSNTKRLLIISTECFQRVRRQHGDPDFDEVDDDDEPSKFNLDSERTQETSNGPGSSSRSRSRSKSTTQPHQGYQTCPGSREDENKNAGNKSDDEDDSSATCSILEYLQFKLNPDSLTPFCPQVYVTEEEDDKSKKEAPSKHGAKSGTGGGTRPKRWNRTSLPEEYQQAKTPFAHSEPSTPAYRYVPAVTVRPRRASRPTKKVLVIKRDDDYNPNDVEEAHLYEYKGAQTNRNNLKAMEVLQKIHVPHSSSSVLSELQHRERQYARKHLLAWQSAIAMPRSKKMPFETAIPIAATRHMRKDLKKVELIRRYIIKLFRCGGSGLYVSDICTQYSIDTFNADYNIMKNIELLPGFGLKRRESLFGNSAPKMMDLVSGTGEHRHQQRVAVQSKDGKQEQEEMAPEEPRQPSKRSKRKKSKVDGAVKKTVKEVAEDKDKKEGRTADADLPLIKEQDHENAADTKSKNGKKKKKKKKVRIQGSQDAVADVPTDTNVESSDRPMMGKLLDKTANKLKAAKSIVGHWLNPKDEKNPVDGKTNNKEQDQPGSSKDQQQQQQQQVNLVKNNVKTVNATTNNTVQNNASPSNNEKKDKKTDNLDKNKGQ